MVEDGEKENTGKNKSKNSQGKDPKTFEDNSQGGDPSTLERKSQGNDARTVEGNSQGKDPSKREGRQEVQVKENRWVLNGSAWSTEKMHEEIQRKVRYLFWDRAQIEEGGNGRAVQQRSQGRMETCR